jgi:hypothetical protein
MLICKISHSKTMAKKKQKKSYFLLKKEYLLVELRKKNMSYDIREWKCQVHCLLRSYMIMRNREIALRSTLNLIMVLSMWDVLMVMTVKSLIFWDGMTYSLTEVYWLPFQRNILLPSSGQKSKPSKQQAEWLY